MKQLEDNSIDSAKKKFHVSIFLLVLAIIYLISPIDLIPGPPPVEWIEDIPILILTSLNAGYRYYKLKKEREKTAT